MTEAHRSRGAGSHLAAYVGRWVALAEDEVAGVGETATAAMRLGRRNRPRERLEVRFVEPSDAPPLAFPLLFEKLRDILVNMPVPVFLVGGAVRDILLGREAHDLDFVVRNQAISVAFRVADELGLPAYILDRERDTGRVVMPDQGVTLDFARFRQPDLEGDLRDRDFTVNAMALPVGAHTLGSLVDPSDGQIDLAERWLRQTHERSIMDDPVRALRAVRLSVDLTFRLHPETSQAASKAATRLGESSVERVRDELVRLMQSANPSKGVTLLQELGLLEVVLPEVSALDSLAQPLPHRYDCFEHTLSVLRWVRHLETWLWGGEQPLGAAIDALNEHLEVFREPLRQHFSRAVAGGLNGRVVLRLGALLHDVGKAATGEVGEDGRIRFHGHESAGARMARHSLRRLHMSSAAVSQVERIVAGHMRPFHLRRTKSVTRRAAYRYFRDTASAGLDIAVLALADHLGTYEGIGDRAQWQGLLRVSADLIGYYCNQHAEVIAPRPLVGGRALMDALALSEGPTVGRLIRLITEAQASGEISTTEEALALARQALEP